VLFFQAGDDIRYFHVTGVQTCALPICEGRAVLLLLKRNSASLTGIPVGSYLQCDTLQARREEPNPLSRVGRNGSAGRSGLERRGPRARVAGSSSAAARPTCIFQGGNREERGGAVRGAAAAGAPG